MQLRAGSAGGEAGVVAGGDEVGFELQAVCPQPAELERAVADDTGIGRASREVFVGEIVDDPGELALEVERVKRDVQLVGDAAGVGSVRRAAATLLVIGPAVVDAVNARAHEQSDDVVTLLL